MRALIRHSSIAAAVAAALTIGIAQAQSRLESLTQFDLPAQPLGESIRAIARLTNVNILVDAPLVQGIDAPAIRIRATPQQVLELLLAGSGLTPRYVDENTVTLLSAEQVRAKQPQASLVGQEHGIRPLVLAQADTMRSDLPRSTRQSDAPTIAPKPQQTIGVEEIVVTGTHIRGVTSSASPTFSVQREDFAKWGATSVQDVLRKISQNFTGGASAHGSAIAAGKNGNEYNSNFGSGINLRGLGNSSTLVLLNGQRIAPGGLGAFVDVSAIPLSALERIDVITDGASAIYGSDAVGGVVNFVLRERFDGAESNLRYGSVTSGGLQQFDANQLFGSGWETGAAFVTLDYQDRTRLLASDRGYANALASRPTDLIPEQSVQSALLNGHQELGAALKLSATLYINDRDVDQELFNKVSGHVSASQVETQQAGGTLALDWRVSPTWNVGLSHTYTRGDTTSDVLLTRISGVIDVDSTSTYTIDASVTELIVDGPIFAAPGGQARLAFGGELRAESLDATRRGSQQVALLRPVALERDIDALFAEANVPLVGAQNARAGVQRLDLIAAVRHEEYSDFGSTTDPKLGVIYSPVTGVDLRGTYGTSFRAPSLHQFDDSFAVGALFRAVDTGLITLLLDQAPGENLGPENATTWTAGLDIRPQALPGLEISATYFNIDYEDRITSGRFSFAPSSNPLTSPRVSVPPDPDVMAMLAYISQRDPTAFLNFTGDPDLTVDDIQATYDTRLLNTAVTSVSGVDLVASHSFDVAGHQLGAGFNASYMLSLENQVTSSSSTIDVVDTIFNPVDLRLRSFLTWSRGSWSAAAYLNYVDSYVDNQLPEQRRVPSWTTFDLSAAYTSQSGLTVRVCATNVFDRAPPRIREVLPSYGDPGYDTENADPLGRYVSVMLSLAW